MRQHAALELAWGEVRTAQARSRGLLVAVALGAGLVVATAVLGATMQQQVSAGAGVEYARADLLVRSDQGVAAGVDPGTSSGTAITADDVRTMAALPGVATASPIVRAEAAIAVDDQVRGALLETLPDPQLVWQRVADGRFPVAGAEVALSRETLDRLGVGVGDTVAIGTPEAGRAVFTIVGAVDVRGSLRYSSLVYGVVTERVAQAFAGLDESGGFNEVQVRLDPGADPDAVVAEVNAAVPVGFPLLTVDATEATERLYGTGLGVLGGLLSGFAVVAALVATVVLATVVSASLPGRRRQLAMLRAIGATRGQLRASVALEMGLLSLLGGLVAVPLGIVVAAVALPLVGHLPGVPDLSVGMLDLPAGRLVAVPLVALVIGVLAALVPAWRVGRVAPAAALRGDDAGSGRLAGRARGLAVGVTLAALVALLLAARSGRPVLTAVVGLVVAVSWIAAMPTLCRVLAGLAGRLTAQAHPVAELAAAQVRRFPGRVAVTGLAATLAATMLSLSWVVLASLDATADDRATVEPGPEVVVGAYAGGPTLLPGTTDELARLDGVTQVLEIESAAATLDGASAPGSLGGSRRTQVSGNVTALDGDDLARATEGRFPLDEVRPGVAYLPASDLPPFADDATITLSGPDGRRRLTVEYVADLPFQALVAPAELDATGAVGRPTAVWLALADGVDRPAVLDDVLAVAVLAGGQPVSGSAPAEARVDQAIDLARGLATGMLVVSVAIAVLGAALTVTTSVRERATELATLRLVGMDGADVRRMVAAETWVMATLSVVAGLLLGLVLGAAAVVAAARALDLGTHLVVPVVPLLLLGVGQVVAMRLAVTGPLDRVSLIAPVRALREAATGGAR